MNQALWLLLRAIVAIALMVGFYVLALVVIGVLLWIPYAEVAYLRVFSLKLTLACLAGALMTFVSILPRRDAFTPPGPGVTEDDEPRLFAFIRGVASDMGEKAPREVYLVGDANAWVTNRGGVMGFGSRRVMGLGLPLLQALPVQEFRAVLAHEFGHFKSSDLMLGPWIHKTYGAIRRTVTDAGAFVVFRWYGTVFLRITQSISRHQEIVADRLAAQVAGASALGRALRRVSTVGPAYQVYFQNDVVPVVRAGFLPPVIQGFDRFLRGVRTRQLTDGMRKALEAETVAGAMDSHPPLRERLSALGCADTDDLPPEVSDPASGLLNHAERYTTELLQRAIGEERIQALRPIAWDAVAQSIYVKRWADTANACAPVLGALTFETVPASQGEVKALAEGWKIKAPVDARVAFLMGGMQSALATRLIADGWTPEVHPGDVPVFIKGEQRCHPLALVGERVTGRMSHEQWLEQCAALNLSGPLVDPQSVPAEEPAAATPPPPASDRGRRRRRGW